MGFCLGSMYNLPKLNPFTGHCRQLLSSRFSVLFIDGKGVKQSLADKLKLPDKPKKPLTPFFRYMQQIRPSIVQQYPNEPLPAISKIISERWESLDQKAKADLELQYKKEKELYDSAKLKYENSLTEEQKQAISEDRLKVQEAKSKKKLKQKAKEHDRPRRPPSSYVLFSLSKANSRGNTPVTQWQKELSKEWKNLDPSQKDKYISQAKEKQSVYLKQMQVWEEKMINLGHVDIVRTETLLPKSPPKTKSKK